MADLHTIGHLVAMVLVALLIKQYMQLRFQFHDYKKEQGETTALAHTSCPVGGVGSDRDTDTCTRKVTYTDTRNVRVQEHQQQTVENMQSSGWCSGTSKDGQFCHFNNLCYSFKEDEFVVFVGPDSLFENIYNQDNIMSLPLSSLKSHNTQERTLVEVPSSSGTFTVHWIHKQTLLFRRFKPDNLMHVLHDDIIPLYHTLRLITMATRDNQSEPFDVQLVFDDVWDAGVNSQLYTVLSSHDIILTEDLASSADLTCFTDIYVGVTSTTTWYQYGFAEPQGPITSHQANGEMIRNAAEFILKSMPAKDNMYEVPKVSGDYFVLFTRQENRKILNDLELSLGIAGEARTKVLSVSLESFSLSYILSVIRDCKGIIGMHGSLLSLAVFLKPGAILVELFPYAVNPVNYTPYASLAGLPGMNLVYRSWTNQNKEDSVGHPDWPAEVGGLAHLSDEERLEILQQTEVLAHLCCNDPSWLYHIYQDTKVDVTLIISLVKSALEVSKSVISNNKRVPILPSSVRNVSCVLIKLGERYTLAIDWLPAYNLKYLQYKEVTYHILLQGTSKQDVQTFQTIDVRYVVKGVSRDVYNVWIQCKLDSDVTGKYSDVTQCDDSD